MRNIVVAFIEPLHPLGLCETESLGTYIVFHERRLQPAAVLTAAEERTLSWAQAWSLKKRTRKGDK